MPFFKTTSLSYILLSPAPSWIKSFHGLVSSCHLERATNNEWETLGEIQNSVSLTRRAAENSVLAKCTSYVRRSDARLIGLMSSRYPFVGIAKSCTGAERATAAELWSLTAGIAGCHRLCPRCYSLERAPRWTVRDRFFSDFSRESFEWFGRWETGQICN